MLDFLENIRINGPYGLMDFEPRSYQQNILMGLCTHRNNIVLNSRQTGMSTLLLINVLYETMIEGKDVCFVCPNYNQTKNKNKIIRCIIESNGYSDNIIRMTTDKITFTSGGTMYFKGCSVDSNRGTSLDHVVCDDFAFYRNQEDLLSALYPAISQREGKLTICSVPNGDNYFKQLWENENNFNKMFVRWQDIEGRSDTFKHEMTQIMGQQSFSQQYEGDFVEEGV